ncbi:hypothetical protein FHS76_002498 [Ochrobactrum daejeonense]|uniref:Uncharacterized protein n=1 Tax=Brucella daejeonensis TaxID=659015 RepID=A0A7W9ELR1_9HYPH|nr:hypothetical protein [Brucella daejeonensis]MBB5702614.1 hypothetical protein [Brucella daejeonensis]
MLIGKLARHRRSKLSVTLADCKKGRAGANALSGKLFHDKTNIAEFGQKECAIFPTEEKGGQNRLF